MRKLVGKSEKLRILSLLPFLVGLSNIFGIQIMVNFGLQRLLARILMGAGLLNLVLAVFLATPLKHAGVALASLVTETVVTLATFAALQRNGLYVFRAVSRTVDKPDAGA